MRIAFITPEYVAGPKVPGGTANSLGRTCAALAAAGHEVAVFVPADAPGKLRHNGVDIHQVAVSHPLAPWISRLTFRRLDQLVQWLARSYYLNRACGASHGERPFDIIQYTSYGGVGFFRPRSVTSVMRAAGYQPLFQAADRTPASLEKPLMNWMFKKAIRQADAVFCPSRCLAGIIEKELTKPAAVIEPAFPPVVRTWPHLPAGEAPGGGTYLLTFGQLGLRKGVDIIAEIIRDVLARHDDLHWVFIGKDFRPYGRPLMDQVLEKSGPHRARVHSLGSMSHDRLFPILEQARAVVLPSRIDNLPNTCLEAMALGRVVIGTRGASFDQLIDDGESGFLCDIGSPESLRAAVERALALTDAEREAMGARAVERIDELRPEKTIPALVAFYEAVIRDHRSN